MIDVQPKVFLLAKTALSDEGVIEYLRSIGQEKWFDERCDFEIDEHGQRWRLGTKCSEGETLVEFGGKLCYRSWAPYDETNKQGTNPNVSKVRDDTKEYLGNILRQRHGSIFEHVSCTFLAANVSRVFTHELVRHRAGFAYSQESMRYVRLSEIPFWLPADARDNPEGEAIIRETVGYLEGVQCRLMQAYRVDEQKDFGIKKRLTSFFRRLAPDGVATNIMFTGNLRAFRHVISLRTALAAEEEIRIVFSEIAETLAREYPLIFQDMTKNKDGEYVFEFDKI